MADQFEIPNTRGAVDLSQLAGASTQPATSQHSGENGVAADNSAGGDIVATLPDLVMEGDEQALQQCAQLSVRVPVLVEMYASWSSDCEALAPVLADAVRAQRGRIVLLRIDLDASPSLGKQPQVLALLGGQAMPLFQGNPPQQQVTQLVGELVQVAAQQGITGRVAVQGATDETDGSADESAEPEVPEAHRHAVELAESGDFDGAAKAYREVLAADPADAAAQQSLASVSLLSRLKGHTASDVRNAAAEAPTDVDAQLLVADLDLSGGHIEDAFTRLLDVFASASPEDKQRIRERLLDLFVLVGDDPRVTKARAQLTNLLFA